MVTTELRRDPVTGRWVVIEMAPVKSRREFEPTPQAPKPPSPQASKDHPCAFCEGQEAAAGRELLAWREGTPADGPGWSVRVVPNRRPVLGIAGTAERRVDGLFESRDGLGAHEVVIESPTHDETLAAMPVERLWRVLWAWRTRLQDLKRDTRFVAAVVFKNHGRAAGALMDHSHSQIVAYPVIPSALDDELRGCTAHHAQTGHCLSCDILQQEIRARVRVVLELPDVVAVVPYASRTPFEVWLSPRAHAARFEEASDATLAALAGALRAVLAGVDWALERPAYNLVLRTAPFDGRADDAFHWHLEVVPRVTRIGGLEWGSGIARNPVSPEEAASALRVQLAV